MSKDFPNLLSPITIGPKQIRNRVLVTAHVPGLEQNGLVTEEYIAYQRARARGGAGLQISGSSAVHVTGGVGEGRGLDNTNADILEGYQRLADAIHAEDGAFLIQLGHAAATVMDTDLNRPLLAPSAVQSNLIRETPREMSLIDIDEVIEAHAEAAGLVRRSGLDGIELLGAFGYLIAAFFSPLTNRRTDDYGGSLENRMRFALRVVDAVREAAGPDLIVGMRIPGEERVPGGLSVDDMKEISKLLAESGKLDYLNVIVGTNYDRIQRMEHWPPTPAPHGLFTHLAADIKTCVAIPVFTTGRITDPQMADQIVARGEADMVGMTRAHISDPDLVAKIRDGRPDDIRPCVGANVCIAHATEGKALRCLHNPLAGRERAWGPAIPTERPRHVLVIGGGPAGMEAARVAAERGHRVTLREAGAELGGQLALWAKTPMMREFAKSVSWYEGQLEHLQVRVDLNSPVTKEEIGTLEADSVILATGARPIDIAPVPGAKDSEILSRTAWEVIEEPTPGAHCLIIDEGGGRTGLAAADAALDRGNVTLISSDAAIGELVNSNLRTPMYKRLLRGGAKFRPGEELLRIEGRTVITRNIYSGEETAIEAVDQVVNWKGNQVVNELQETLAKHAIDFKVVGDCLAPRQAHIAFAEGALAARAL